MSIYSIKDEVTSVLNESFAKTIKDKKHININADILDIKKSSLNGDLWAKIYDGLDTIDLKILKKFANSFRENSGEEFSKGMNINFSAKFVFNSIDNYYLSMTQFELHYNKAQHMDKASRIKNELYKNNITKNNIELLKNWDAETKKINISMLAPNDSHAIDDFKNAIYRINKVTGIYVEIENYIFSYTQRAFDNKNISLFMDAEQSNSDFIIIIRGGGEFKELALANDIDLAKRIALSKKPVYTAIGHLKDKVALDYFATESFATPSECGERLLKIIYKIFFNKINAKKSYPAGIPVNGLKNFNIHPVFNFANKKCKNQEKPQKDDYKQPSQINAKISNNQNIAKPMKEDFISSEDKKSWGICLMIFFICISVAMVSLLMSGDLVKILENIISIVL